MPTSREPLLRGAARMKEIAAEAEIERNALVAEILSDLGRPATALDRIAAQSIASAHIKACRLRALGRDDLDQQRLIAQLVRATGLKPDKPAPPKQEDFTSEMLRLATPQARAEARAVEGAETAADSEQRTDGLGSQSEDGAA
jgi:hypothetical protein